MSPSTASSQTSTAAAAVGLVADEGTDGDAEGAVQGRRHDQPGRHPEGVAVDVEVDAAG